MKKGKRQRVGAEGPHCFKALPLFSKQENPAGIVRGRELVPVPWHGAGCIHPRALGGFAQFLGSPSCMMRHAWDVPPDSCLQPSTGQFRRRFFTVAADCKYQDVKYNVRLHTREKRPPGRLVWLWVVKPPPLQVSFQHVTTSDQL